MVRLVEAEGMTSGLSEVEWSKLDHDQIPEEQFKAWEDEFGKFFMTKTKEYLYEKGREYGTFLMPVYNVKELLDDTQLIDRAFWLKVEHPELGAQLIYPGASFKSSRRLWRLRRRAPLIGEHNEEVYIDELGLSREELASFEQSHII